MPRRLDGAAHEVHASRATGRVATVSFPAGISWIRSHEARLKVQQAQLAEKLAAGTRKMLKRTRNLSVQAQHRNYNGRRTGFSRDRSYENGDCVIVENLVNYRRRAGSVLARTVIRKGRQMFLRLGGEDASTILISSCTCKLEPILIINRKSAQCTLINLS